VQNAGPSARMRNSQKFNKIRTGHRDTVQFSSVQFSSNGVPRRSSLPDPSGASDREGTARRNWNGWTSGVMVWLPQCRTSSARGPPLTSLGVLAFGLDMAVKAAMAAGAAAARALEGVTE
jgi:hypothetical protein